MAFGTTAAASLVYHTSVNVYLQTGGLQKGRSNAMIFIYLPALMTGQKGHLAVV